MGKDTVPCQSSSSMVDLHERTSFANPVAYLEAITCADKSSRIPLFPRQEIFIGRAEECDHVILDGLVSKQHFRLYSVIYEEDDDNFQPLIYCEDLESTNGTYVNNILIGILCRETVGHLLNDGDIIEIRPYWRFLFRQHFITTVSRDEMERIDLRYFQDQFTISNRILGKGSYGAVYLGQETATLRQVACKIVNFNLVGQQLMERRSPTVNNSWLEGLRHDAEGKKIAKREIKILSQLSHPHVINLKKAFVSNDAMNVLRYIFTDLAPAGDLYSYLLSQGGKLKDWHSRIISYQIALAIQYLHTKGVAHRDIKPENVLVTHTNLGGRVILTDFGFANYVDAKTGRLASLVGTVGYTAPEVESIENEKLGYTLAADLWSLGVLTACILSGTSSIPSIGELSRLGQVEFNEHFQGREWGDISVRARRFLTGLLTVDYNKRMTIAEALEHSWFKKPTTEAKLLELSYQKIIRFWKDRPGGDNIIQDLPSRTTVVADNQRDSRSPRHIKKFPDTTSSPYFNVNRHLQHRPLPMRQTILDVLHESGVPFLPSQDSKLPSADRGETVIPVDGLDIFGTSYLSSNVEMDGEVETNMDEVCLVCTDSLPARVSQVESVSQSDQILQNEETEKESRQSKRIRRHSEREKTPNSIMPL